LFRCVNASVARLFGHQLTVATIRVAQFAVLVPRREVATATVRRFPAGLE
jgi:hypothetical protein